MTLDTIIKEIAQNSALSEKKRFSAIKDITEDYQIYSTALQKKINKIKKYAEKIKTAQLMQQILENLYHYIKDVYNEDELITKENSKEILAEIKKGNEICRKIKTTRNKQLELITKKKPNKKLTEPSYISDILADKTKKFEEKIEQIQEKTKEYEIKTRMLEQQIITFKQEIHNIDNYNKGLNAVFEYLTSYLRKKTKEKTTITDEEKKEQLKHTDSGIYVQQQINKTINKIITQKETNGDATRSAFTYHLIDMIYLIANRIQNTNYKHRAVEIKQEYECLKGTTMPEKYKKNFTDIINNFINNAQKFTYEGEISITAIKHNQCKENTILQISIKDTGLGIEEDKLSEIFKDETQLNPSAEGYGIGLATAYDIAKKNNWEIKVESEICKGSTFSLYMPIPKQ